MTNVGNGGFRLSFPKMRFCYGENPIANPKEVLERGIGDYASYKQPQEWCNNVRAGKNKDGSFIIEHQAKEVGDFSTNRQVIQRLSADGKTKVTKIIPWDDYEKTKGKGSFEMVQTLAEDGTYQCRRIGNGVEHVKQIKPKAGKKALTGFTGKLEKAFMALAQDANGCERPVLRRISGTAIKILRRGR